MWLKRGSRFLKDCFSVLVGKKTWVDYLSEQHHLPKLRPGVISHQFAGEQIPAKTKAQLDFFYAKDYHWTLDLRVIGRAYWKSWP